jgi:hypothetical protein
MKKLYTQQEHDIAVNTGKLVSPILASYMSPYDVTRDETQRQSRSVNKDVLPDVLLPRPRRYPNEYIYTYISLPPRPKPLVIARSAKSHSENPPYQVSQPPSSTRRTARRLQHLLPPLSAQPPINQQHTMCTEPSTYYEFCGHKIYHYTVPCASPGSHTCSPITSENVVRDYCEGCWRSGGL